MLTILWGTKILQHFSKILKFGGGTWPGHLILKFQPSFLKDYLSSFSKGFILITGTNGKTTTTALITSQLRQEGWSVVTNSTGANLTNGIASALISDLSLKGNLQSEIGVFEVDENFLGVVLKEASPRQIIILNLFRDQLDRYGEVDSIADKWEESLSLLDHSQLILNADDPTVATIAQKSQLSRYFFGLGLAESLPSGFRQVQDSLFCRNCGGKLSFIKHYFSHLGEWRCESCQEKSPPLSISFKIKSEAPLPGYFNEYNLAAASLSLQLLGLEPEVIGSRWQEFSPVFGRFEELVWKGQTFRLCLAKNPTGMNEALRTVLDSKNSSFPLVIALNDHIPDGRDISWIWDVDFELLVSETQPLWLTGDRSIDLAARLHYAQKGRTPIMVVESDWRRLFSRLVSESPSALPIPVVATYSAMLGIRKFLKGKSLL